MGRDQYLKEVFRWPWSALIFGLSFLGAFTALTDNWWATALVISGIFLSALTVRSMQVGYKSYRSGITPIGIINTIKTNYYDGEVVYLVLEDKSWIETGQLFRLEVLHDQLPEPLGYIAVETRLAGSGHYVATLFVPFREGVEEITLDPRMRRSLQARPIMWKEDLYRLPRRPSYE